MDGAPGWVWGSERSGAVPADALVLCAWDAQICAYVYADARRPLGTDASSTGHRQYDNTFGGGGHGTMDDGRNDNGADDGFVQCARCGRGAKTLGPIVRHGPGRGGGGGGGGNPGSSGDLGDRYGPLASTGLPPPLPWVERPHTCPAAKAFAEAEVAAVTGRYSRPLDTASAARMATPWPPVTAPVRACLAECAKAPRSL